MRTIEFLRDVCVKFFILVLFLIFFKPFSCLDEINLPKKSFANEKTSQEEIIQYRQDIAQQRKIINKKFLKIEEKLELILCDEATLQGLREKMKEARESSKTAHIKEAKTEDDALFYSNYGEWKRQQK